MINQFSEQDPVWIGGMTVLQYYSLDGQSAWANLGYVFAFFAFFTCVRPALQPLSAAGVAAVCVCMHACTRLMTPPLGRCCLAPRVCAWAALAFKQHQKR